MKNLLMYYSSMKFKMIMVLLLSFWEVSYAQIEHPLPPAKEMEFQKEISKRSTEDLESMLYSEVSFHKKGIIIEALCKKDKRESLKAVSKFVSIIQDDIEKSPMKNIFQEMLWAKALVCQKKLEYSDSDIQFSQSFKEMLLSQNSHLVYAAASELGISGTPLARNILEEVETVTLPIVKINRLIIDTQKMPSEEFLRLIFQSASKTIINAKESEPPKLVAERTLISWRNEPKVLRPIVLDEISHPSYPDKHDSVGLKQYLNFLTDIDKHLQFIRNEN